MTSARFFAIAALLLTVGTSKPARATDVVAVCPPPFREALQPWIEHRQSEGLQVTTIDSCGDAFELQQRIRAASDPATRYVVLVGDAPVLREPCDPQRRVPIHYVSSRVTAQWGSTPKLASDLDYGNLRGDASPEAAVGRLPVDTPAQLERLVDRILAYERSTDFGPWRGRVQLTGGVGGFGALVDGMIETVTRTVLTSVLPPEAKASIAYASPGHRFFPDGGSFTDAVLERYRQGARFWVYAGHGWVDRLDRVPKPAGDSEPVLDAQSVQRLQRAADGAPIALMLACYTGALDAARESLAERMVLTSGGPIAVFAGSRVTMPYGNSTAAIGLINGVYERKCERLGDAWLTALEQMEAPGDSQNKPASRVVIDALAAMVSPSSATLAEERREHMRLYNLIGDPTLRLHQPQPLALEAPAGQTPGEPLRLKIQSPIAGQLSVSIDRPLGASTGDAPNRTSVASWSGSVPANRQIAPTIELPPDLRGPLIIRAQVAGDQGWATAAARTILH